MECKNCLTSLQEDDNFCNNCGGKVIRNRLTLKNVLNDFSEQFLNYDNRFLRTYINLFTKPGEVIGGYLRGTRKKYVNVISYFAIALTFSGLQIFLLNKFFPEVLDLSAVTAEGTEEFSKRNLDFINEYQSIVMMFYVPIYAFLAKLVFLKKKTFNYTELLVIFTYILSQISITTSVLTIIAAFFGVSLGVLVFIFMLLQILYSAYCLKHLYGLSMEGIILRTLLFLLILSIFFIVITIAIAIIVRYTVGFEEFINVKKANEVSYIISSAMNWTS